MDRGSGKRDLKFLAFLVIALCLGIAALIYSLGRL